MKFHTLRGAILGLLMVACAFAQFTTASLSGSLLDPSGASLPDAQVTVRNVDTGFTLTIKSDSAGAFRFSRLPVGTYQMTVEKPGFTTYVPSGIQLSGNQNETLSVTMR